MRKIIAFIVGFSHATYPVSVLALNDGSDELNAIHLVSRFGTVGERAYLTRFANVHNNALIPRPLPPTLDTDALVKALSKKVDTYDSTFKEYQEFERQEYARKNLLTSSIETKQSIVKYTKLGVDIALFIPTNTPLTIAAKPVVSFLKEKAFAQISENLRKQLEEAEKHSKAALTVEYLHKLRALTGTDKMSTGDAQKLYHDVMGKEGLSLNSTFNKTFWRLNEEQSIGAIKIALQESVFDTLNKFATTDQALADLQNKYQDLKQESIKQKSAEARDLVQARVFMGQLAQSMSSENQNTEKILANAQTFFRNAETPIGAVLAQGVVHQATLNSVFANTNFLVAQSVSKMTPSQLVDAIDKKQRLPGGIELDATTELSLRLQAQRDKMQSFAQNFQTISSEMLRAAVVMGMDPAAARAANAVIGVTSGFLAIALASGPPGYIVAAVGILSSVMGMFAGSSDSGQQQLMESLRHLSDQMESLKLQLLELQMIITRQNADLLQKLDLEFSRTKNSLESLSKMANYDRFTKSFQKCLSLESDHITWMKGNANRYKFEDKDIVDFFKSDEKHGKNFEACIDSLAGIRDVTNAGNLNFFFIFQFGEAENGTDASYARVDGYRQLISYMNEELIHRNQDKVLNPQQLNTLAFKILSGVTKNYAWESYRNLNQGFVDLTSLNTTASSQNFQQGLISITAVFYYIRALTILNQFAPYLDAHGHSINPVERMAQVGTGKYFENSATGKISELVLFIEPFLQAAVAQENLLSGAFVSDVLARKYVQIEEQATAESARYWSKEVDVGFRFPEQNLVSLNPATAQNFLASVVRYQNFEHPTDSLIKFNHLIKEGRIQEAYSFLPPATGLITQDEMKVKASIASKQALLQKLNEDLGLIRLSKKTPESTAQASRKDSERFKLENEIAQQTQVLKQLRSSAPEAVKGKPVYYALSPSLQGEQQISAIEVSKTRVQTNAFKQSTRLTEILSMRAELSDLHFDYFWHDVEDKTLSEKLDQQMKELQ